MSYALARRQASPKATASVVCQEPQGGLASRRITQPAGNLATVVGECCAEQFTVCGHVTPIRPRIGDNNPSAGVPGSPAALARDFGCQSPPSIHGAQQLVDVDKLRLELDDEQGPAPRVPGNKIDDASLAEVVERNLGDDVPTGVAEPTRDLLAHRSMAAMQEPIEVAATPSRDDIDANLEGGSGRPDRAQGGGIQMAALKQGVSGSRNAGPNSHISPSIVPAQPDAAERQAHPLVIHRSTLSGDA